MKLFKRTFFHAFPEIPEIKEIHIKKQRYHKMKMSRITLVWSNREIQTLLKKTTILKRRKKLLPESMYPIEQAPLYKYEFI